MSITTTAAPSALEASKLVKGVMEGRQPSTSSSAPLAEGDGAPVPEAKADEQISPKFAALARKEKAIRSKAQELKAWEDRLKAKEAEYESSYVPKAALKERLKNDVLGFMQENEITYDDLTQAVLNGPNQESLEIKKLQAKIAELESKTNQTNTKFDEAQKKAYDNAVQQLRNEAKLLVDESSDFETIKEADQTEAVVALIEETFRETGKILTVKEAAKEVEDYLVEEAFKMAQFKKVKSKLLPSTSEEGEAPEATMKPKEASSAQIKTLTNGMTPASKPLSAEDRRRRAILAFQGQLK